MRIAHAQFNSQLSSAPQPADAPRGHGRGLDPDRVLLFSSREFAGSGVVSHQLALAGRLADEISKATRRGTDVDLSVHNRRRIQRASDSIRSSKLQTYDAVVVALGQSDAFALTPPKRWSSRMESLLDQIRAKSVAGTPIIVAGIPVITFAGGASSTLVRRAQKHAEQLDTATEKLCAKVRNATFVPIPPSARNGTGRPAFAYTECARHIARQLSRRLPKPGQVSKPGERTARSNRAIPQSSTGRQQSLLDLGITLTRSNDQLDRTVNFARTYFRAQHAALVLFDGDRISFTSKSGFRGNPDLVKLASPIVDTGRPTVIENTNPANSNLLSVHVGGVEMSFYAGYPIETPDGYRIGVLSVFDPDPRPARASDTVVLRDLAMLLQRELWAGGERVGDHE
ncbi:MAG: GDSL-type esterase/lipase family protein [Homoserinimonas sp.]